jgi:hypothetical protein
MERFARSITAAAVSDELDAALHGRGAFRRFKDAVRRLGIADDWYRFRDAALEEMPCNFWNHTVLPATANRSKNDVNLCRLKLSTSVLF